MDWDDVVDATAYRVLIDEDPAFGSPLIDYSFPAGPSNYYPASLAENTVYYWKVKALNICDESSWSESRSFSGKNIPKCGDVNNDTKVNVSDAVLIINYVFIGGSPPDPNIACGDVNEDHFVNVSDAVYLINFIFIGGPPPDECAPHYWDPPCFPYEGK